MGLGAEGCGFKVQGLGCRVWGFLAESCRKVSRFMIQRSKIVSKPMARAESPPHSKTRARNRELRGLGCRFRAWVRTVPMPSYRKFPKIPISVKVRGIQNLYSVDSRETILKPKLSLLGGSWVVLSGVIGPRIWVITIVTLLITTLIATHEPPSNSQLRMRGESGLKIQGLGRRV